MLLKFFLVHGTTVDHAFGEERAKIGRNAPKYSLAKVYTRFNGLARYSQPLDGHTFTSTYQEMLHEIF
jgi:hypothetical protein